MKTLRRLLFVPALIVLGGAVLVMMNIIAPDTDLPLQQIAMIAAAVAGSMLAVLSIWEGYATVQGWTLPDPEEPPSADYVIYPKDPVNKVEITIQTIDDAEDFSQKAQDSAQHDIDTEHARANGKKRVEIDLEVDDEYGDED
jgi:hypothetical protein